MLKNNVKVLVNGGKDAIQLRENVDRGLISTDRAVYGLKGLGDECLASLLGIHRLGREGYLEEDQYTEYKTKFDEYSKNLEMYDDWFIEKEFSKSNFIKDLRKGFALLGLII